MEHMKCSENLTLLEIEFWIWLQSFKWKIKNKRGLWKWLLKEQERHLTLGMTSSETTHGGGGGESTCKNKQGKTWATKTQLDLSINMAINNWLLACKD
jgi:hypothetical protein